jgi:hypothetical protein
LERVKRFDSDVSWCSGRERQLCNGGEVGDFIEEYEAVGEGEERKKYDVQLHIRRILRSMIKIQLGS